MNLKKMGSREEAIYRIQSKRQKQTSQLYHFSSLVYDLFLIFICLESYNRLSLTLFLLHEASESTNNTPPGWNGNATMD